MIRLLILISLLFCQNLLAVQYVVWGGAIETNGWNLRLTNATAPNLDATTAANTNLQFFNGFLTNNTPSITNGLIITWDDMGYSNSTPVIIKNVTAYGTKLVRIPYPMQNTNDVQPSNVTNSVIRIALSKSISSFASNITITLATGAIASTNGTAFTNVMGTNITIVNESLQKYTKVGGNWSPGTPMFATVSNTMRLRAVGFHAAASQGKPVELCRFISTGLTSGVKVTNDVYNMTVDHEFNLRSPAPVTLDPAEFIADVDLSGMTALETIRSDIQIFPKIGNSFLDTTTDTFPVGFPRECAINNVYDPNNAHSRVVFVVDSVNGNDSNGRCRTNVAPTSISSGEYFLTIGAALNNGAGSNNTFYGHNDTSGIIGYCLSCTNYPGVNITATTVPKVAPIIRPYPGNTNVTLTHVIAGSSASMKRIKFENISTAWASATVPFSSYGFLWFDQATSIVSISTAPIGTTTNVIFTHSKIGSFAQGLKAAAAGNTAFNLRGCWLSGFIQTAVPKTHMGNYHGNTNDGAGYSISVDANGDLSPDGNVIVYNNFFDGKHHAGNVILIESNITDVCSIVQNVFINCMGGQPGAAICSATGNNNTYTNLLFWNNLVEGGRIADFASDSGSAVIPHVQFSINGNIWAYPGQKSDTDGTPNAARWYGAAEILHMVGGRGNFYIRNHVDSSTTSFRPFFAGMYTYEPGYTNIVNFVAFVDRQAATVPTFPLGGGNYRELTQSPTFVNVYPEWVIPYDIEGKPRSIIDQPGPYTAGNARKCSLY